MFQVSYRDIDTLCILDHIGIFMYWYVLYTSLYYHIHKCGKHVGLGHWEEICVTIF